MEVRVILSLVTLRYTCGVRYHYYMVYLYRSVRVRKSSIIRRDNSSLVHVVPGLRPISICLDYIVRFFLVSLGHRNILIGV